MNSTIAHAHQHAAVVPDPLGPRPWQARTRWARHLSEAAGVPGAAAAGVRGKIAGQASVLATVRLVPVEFLTGQHGHRLQ